MSFIHRGNDGKDERDILDLYISFFSRIFSLVSKTDTSLISDWIDLLREKNRQTTVYKLQSQPATVSSTQSL